VSAQEKPTLESYEFDISLVEQAGDFLYDEPIEHTRITLFTSHGELIAEAIADIQKITKILGKLSSHEVVQEYYGFEPSRAQEEVKDEKGKPTGETKWVNVHKPGPTGVECVIYLRPLEA
jgi:hypothetical protein